MTVYATKFQKSIVINGENTTIRIGDELTGELAKAALQNNWGSEQKPKVVATAKAATKAAKGA